MLEINAAFSNLIFFIDKLCFHNDQLRQKQVG